MTDIIDDLAILTSIPAKILEKLESDTILCISEGLKENLLEGNTTVNFDLGLGTLTISYLNNQLKYKFVPSAKLNDTIINTVKGSDTPFVQAVNESLVNKLTSLYKDLL